MKKHLLILFSSFISFLSCQAQNHSLWGMTVGGGINDNGIIFSYDISTGTKTTKHLFDAIHDGYDPSGSLIQANNGLLYGMAVSGGTYDLGIIFSYEVSTGKETNLHNFGEGTDGTRPFGTLIQASNGLLYGMTSYGGLYDYGTIFSFDISTGKTTILYNFCFGDDGGYPEGSLIQASNGFLYGITSVGGAYNHGTIFKYDISKGRQTPLEDFFLSTVRYPVGSLIQANNGLLYGMATEGGMYDSGIIFSYDISTDAETDLHSFNGGTDGAFPTGSLVQASNGLLYGMTSKGGVNDAGTVFSYDILGDTETDVHSFGSNIDGSLPQGSLNQASNGLLYGLTSQGGTNNSGVIFDFNIFTGTETDLYDLDSNGIYGQNTLGSFIQAIDGRLYGMTSTGGPFNAGTILSYDISKAKETVLYDFGGGIRDGFSPAGSLIRAKSGLLYGLTSEGGGYGRGGVIFSYDLTKDTETDLHNFGKGVDGTLPYGSLIQASNGLLYGMTSRGGLYDHGTIFSYNMSSDTELILHNFSGDTDGDEPQGSLIQANNGLLYGIAIGGGVNDLGVIFSYNISTGAETNLYNFGSSNDGAEPWGSLIQATNGLLYGMTVSGGINKLGFIYSYNISTDSVFDIHDFSSDNDGAYPLGSLVQANNGLLYGMTPLRGVNNLGTIFNYDISTGTETNLYDFGGVNDGVEARGSLIQANNSLLYGMTEGGVNNRGMIFSYDISSGKVTDLHNFSEGVDGGYPVGDLLEVNDTTTSLKQSPNTSDNIQLYPNPSSTSIHLSLKLQNAQLLNLSLFNILGKQVWAEDLGNNKEVATTIPLSNLANGVYILKVNTGSTSLQKELIIAR